ncbi:MAG: hypothetical protein Q9191_001069 [Dirinaria sp. TL-2023a]
MTSTAQQAQQAYDEALAKLPGLEAPPGQTHNLVNPYSRGWLIVFTSAITLVVTTLLVVIRTYTKRFLNKSGLQWEDCYIGYTSVGFQSEKYGGYVHEWNVPAIKVMRFLQIVNDIEIIYGPVMFLTKLSLVLQMMHIFAPTRSGITHRLCLFMILFNFLFYTIVMFVAIFVCSPRRKFWNQKTPGHCLNIDSVNIITSVINAASDLVLLLLPIICVFRLQMPLRKKFGVSAVFATGAFAYISSIMRILASVRVRGAKDVTWIILPEGLWAQGEISGGIVCGCMATLPQFFRHFVPKITSKFSSGRSHKLSAASSSKQSERKRKPSVVPHLDSQVYMELDDQIHLKPTEDKGISPRVRTDEVTVEDEEKALPPILEDSIADVSQRPEYYK